MLTEIINDREIQASVFLLISLFIILITLIKYEL